MTALIGSATMIRWAGIGTAGFLLGLAGAWLISRYAYRLGLVDQPNARSSHSKPTPRGGGVGILMAFVLTAVLLEIPLGIWCPVALLAILSLFDDRLAISPKIRLGFQFCAALLIVVITGNDCQNPILSILLTVFWSFFVVGTANFYNFMDGINGLAGITGIVVFMLVNIFGCLNSAPEPPLLMAGSLALACLGFLPFNFPSAKVFMGDVGSILLGFMFAVLVLWLSRDLADFLCLSTFMFLFYADTLTTLYIRFRNGEKLTESHRRHLYQIMANELGLPHWTVSIGYGVVQLVTGLLMIWAWHLGLVWQALLLGLICAVFLAYMSRCRRMGKAAVVPLKAEPGL